MPINIRLATENDIESIYALILEFAIFQKTPEKVYITPEQMKQDKNLFQAFVAVDEKNIIIGFASFFFAYYSWIGKSLYLDDLYVTHIARGQKTGTLLLEAVINHAKNNQCKKLRWQVSKWNSNAIEFYKKMGAITDNTEMNCDLYLQ